MAPGSGQSPFDPLRVDRFDDYEVVRYLAEGGMAWVYEARDPRFPARRLALKALKPEAGNGQLFQRFEAEARLLAGVDHPNLVTIFDLERESTTGIAYYTMTYVEGESFVRAQPIPWRSALPPFLGILDGLAELHGRGVVHRDIKPGNMLLKADGRALLADLGMARDPASSGLTRVGTVMGTPAYMPPEQAAGGVVDARSDLFGIGMSIHRVLTGGTLYEVIDGVDARNAHSILRHLAGCVTRGEELSFPFPNDVPQALRNIIERACRFDPDARYATAGELRDDLAGVLEARPVEIRPQSPTRVAAEAMRRLQPERITRVGDYEIVRFVAEGGMGWVFEAKRADQPDQRLALKALKPGISSEGELLRFRTEAQILSEIDHPNLMGVMDTGIDPETGRSFYTMPFLDSPLLSELGQIDPGEAMRIVDGVLTALAELHRRGIVHRDVKPANVLLGRNQTPVLMDLGIARQTGQQTLTSTGMFLGTALYASPEQARGSKIDARSDLFAAGLLLYRLVTGRSAYAAVPEVDVASETSILFYLAKLEHAGEEVGFAMPEEVPTGIREVVERACRYHPEQRYQDALSMRTALRRARRDPARGSAGRRARSLPLVVAAGLAGLTFAVAQFEGVAPNRIVERLGHWLGSATEAQPEAVESVGGGGGASEFGGGPGPRLLSRSPTEALVVLDPDTEVTLSVEVDPAAGNVLYGWRVDGRAAGTLGPSYVYTGDQSARVELTITDRRGDQRLESWKLEAANRAPRLGLVPSASSIQLEVGDVRRFAARASDPDGDGVEVEYLLEGHVVGEGTSFVFRADRPGDFRLVARARDGRGGMVEAIRFVRVAGLVGNTLDPFLESGARNQVESVSEEGRRDFRLADPSPDRMAGSVLNPQKGVPGAPRPGAGAGAVGQGQAEDAPAASSSEVTRPRSAPGETTSGRGRPRPRRGGRR
jgi:serine/threonine protein kinase